MGAIQNLTNSVAPEAKGSSPYLHVPATGPYPEQTGFTLPPQSVVASVV
jgi:hypothetical protein